jgi:ubiquitin-conjugating enzyme E2 G1
MTSSSAAAGLLSRQLKQMQNDKSISGISCGLVESNVFEWEVMLMIDDDTKFYGGTTNPPHPIIRPR